MGGKTDETKELIHVAAEAVVTNQRPVVISFSNWPAEKLPRNLKVELFDVDAVGDDQKKADKKRLPGENDLIVAFSGRLEKGADDEAIFRRSGVTFSAPVKGSADVVHVRFAQEGEKDGVAVGIPSSKGETDTREGLFYELRARLVDPATNDVIKESTIAAVRRRADVLLAVEPLAQGSTDMSDIAGEQIFEHFHPGEADALKKRGWGDVVMRVMDHQIPVLEKGGCSYTVATMLLRYFRVPNPSDPDQDTTLFDRHVDPSTLDPAARPRVRKRVKGELAEYDNEEAAIKEAVRIEKAWKSTRKAFIKKFKEGGTKAEKKESAKALTKKFTQATGKSDGGTVGKHVQSFMSTDPVLEPASPDDIKGHWYPAQLCWRMNMIEKRENFDYRLCRTQHDQKILGDLASFADPDKYLATFRTERATYRSGGATKDLVIESVQERGHGGKLQNGGVVVPITGGFAKRFGLTESLAPHKFVKEYQEAPFEKPDGKTPPWAQVVVDALDRGVPVIGLFSPGSYSFRKSTGHFCVIVGYRKAKVVAPDALDGEEEIRFILNDPALSHGLQYEALTERDLDPTDWNTQQFPVREKEEDKDWPRPGRERRGWNLIIERRMQLSLNEIHIHEPGKKKTSTWDPEQFRDRIFWRGKSRG